MLSTTGRGDHGVRRASPATRRRTLSAAAAASVLLAVLVAPAAAQRPRCLPGCDPRNPDPAACCNDPAVREQCETYLDCREALPVDFRDCVDACDCNFPGCQPTPGRCTLTLECVNDCREATTRHRQSCNRRLAKGIRRSGRCFIGINKARRICHACGFAPLPAAAVPQGGGSTTTSTSTTSSTLPPGPTTTSTTSTTSSTLPSSDCQVRCIGRLMAECYDRCFDRCEGDEEAARICRGHCRDGSCGLLKLRCTLPEDPDDRRDRDPQYLFCCAENDTCDDDVGTDIDCEATTSTTSTTSTTGTTSTTSTTLRTTATTLASTP